MTKLAEEIKNKLTAEQLIIAEGWEKEREERDKVISQFEKGEITTNELADALIRLAPSHCEHGRSIWSTCIECEEIEKIVRPEAFEFKSDEED